MPRGRLIALSGSERGDAWALLTGLADDEIGYLGALKS